MIVARCGQSGSTTEFRILSQFSNQWFADVYCTEDCTWGRTWRNHDTSMKHQAMCHGEAFYPCEKSAQCLTSFLIPSSLHSINRTAESVTAPQVPKHLACEWGSLPTSAGRSLESPATGHSSAPPWATRSRWSAEWCGRGLRPIPTAPGCWDKAEIRLRFHAEIWRTKWQN